MLCNKCACFYRPSCIIASVWKPEVSNHESSVSCRDTDSEGPGSEGQAEIAFKKDWCVNFKTKTCYLSENNNFAEVSSRNPCHEVSRPGKGKATFCQRCNQVLFL